MKKLNASLLSLLLLAPAFSGCASTARTARRATLNPSVDRMLDDVARSPDNSKVSAAIRDGIKAIRKGRYEEAGKSFSAGLRVDPVNGNLHFLNALSYHLSSLSGDQAKLDLAESGYATALRFDPDNYWAAYFLGHVYFSQKRYKDAQNQFSYALLYVPEDAEFLRALATASYYEQSLETGSWAAEKAVVNDPLNPSGWRLVTLTRAAKGNFKEAEEGFLKYQALTGLKAGKKTNGSVQEWTTAYLRNRIEDWKAFHRQHPALIQAAGPGVFKAPVQAEGKPLAVAGQEENYDDSNDDSQQAIPPGPAPAPFSTATKLDQAEPKMTLVDVVMLSTEESRSQSKGVNLLAGLKATLTGTLYAYKYVNARGSGGTSGRSTTVAPTFALENLSYHLNSWNDGMNKAEVQARPSLLAVENQTSMFYSGAVLHVQLNSNNSDGSLVDVPVGINLSITPTFVDDETIRIKVHADRSFIESRSEKLGFTSFSQTSKTSVDATAVMKFGETLILSGLSENETTKSKSGVPFLQSIPIIQSLFSNKTEQEMKKSVMILICPQKAHRAAEHMTPAEARELKKAMRKGPEAVAHLKALKAKEGLDTKDNLDAVYEEIYKGRYYKEFQSGDLRLDEWHNSDSMVGAIKRVLGFLWY
jgi:tetratricopeptide (TPR) repeat protein